MRAIILLVLCVSIVGCAARQGDQNLPPPEAFVRLGDRIAVRMLKLGFPWRYPCTTPGLCLKYGPSTRMQGLWRNDFEGSVFCAAPAQQCSSEATDPKSMDVAVSLPDKWKGLPPGGLYAVDFVGRASIYPGRYGHLGVFRHEVIMDRLISMATVEPPPPPLTKEQQEAETRRCEAEPNCLTFKEMMTQQFKN